MEFLLLRLPLLQLRRRHADYVKPQERRRFSPNFQGVNDQLPVSSRSEIPSQARRVVIKLGTAVLMREKGGLALPQFKSFVESVAKLRKAGCEVIMVSSGAIGLGAERLGITQREELVQVKQACAAVGQGRLMSFYSDAFEDLGLTAAQVLLTEEDFSNRRRYLNVKNTMTKLLELGVVPIINENDTVSTAELEVVDSSSYRKVNFGDNDKLSALVASGMEADLLIVLTDVDGLYKTLPGSSKSPKLIDVIDKITPEIERLADDHRSKGGRGGMKTKLEAAAIAMHSGCAMMIANGKISGIIDRIFAGENVGTFFTPLPGMGGKRRWIAYATTVSAALVVNEGARRALLGKQASLLPAGVLEVRGEFERGDVVSILNQSEQEFARGIVNYSSSEARKISGKHSKKIDELIENPNYDALIKRENMALLRSERDKLSACEQFVSERVTSVFEENTPFGRQEA